MRTSRKVLSTVIGSIVTGALLAPLPVMAALEEVIVTARKTDESIQDVPAAISSFSNEDLKKLNVTQTSDLASFTPSIHIEQPGGNSGTVAKVTIRGQSQSDNIITLDPSVGWYLDDVYLARTQGTATSMFDVDRVEVLKGPQGTLYGRNTTGGTIKLVTTKAETSSGFTGFVVGGVGNYDQSKVGGAINIPIIDNMLAIRLSALKDQVDEGFQDVTLYQGDPTASNRGQIIGHRKNGTYDNELYRVGITFEPLDNLRVLGFYEHNESDVSMANGNLSSSPGPTISAALPNAPFIASLGPFRAQAG
ncbi:MAG: TonB-dependent receptor, partial [Spongiibacteraceae bacterium]